MSWDLKQVIPLRGDDYSTDVSLAAHFGEKYLLRDAEIIQSTVIGTNPFAESIARGAGFAGSEKKIPEPVIIGYSSDESIAEQPCALYHEVQRRGLTNVARETISVRRFDADFAIEVSYAVKSDINELLFLHYNAMRLFGVERGEFVRVVPEPVFKSTQKIEAAPQKLRLSGIA